MYMRIYIYIYNVYMYYNSNGLICPRPGPCPELGDFGDTFDTFTAR